MGVLIQFPTRPKPEPEAPPKPKRRKATVKAEPKPKKAKKAKLQRVEYPDVVVTQAGPGDEDLEEMVGALVVESDADGTVVCVTFDPLPDDMRNWYTDEVGGVVRAGNQIRVRDLDAKCWWRFDVLTEDDAD
jgi:hypothetical protein